MDRAVNARRYLEKAKAARNHDTALMFDKMAATYESQCIKWVDRLMAGLEAQSTFNHFIER
jgi:hypothetical protein